MGAVVEFPPDLPPIVYVPTEGSPAVPEENRVEYRTTRDGRKALLIYSAMDRLTKAMGPHQTWLVCQVKDLEALWELDGFDVVYLDIAVPEDQQRKPASP